MRVLRNLKLTVTAWAPPGFLSSQDRSLASNAAEPHVASPESAVPGRSKDWNLAAGAASSSGFVRPGPAQVQQWECLSTGWPGNPQIVGPEWPGGDPALWKDAGGLPPSPSLLGEPSPSDAEPPWQAPAEVQPQSGKPPPVESHDKATTSDLCAVAESAPEPFSEDPRIPDGFRTLWARPHAGPPEPATLFGHPAAVGALTSVSSEEDGRRDWLDFEAGEHLMVLSMNEGLRSQ